MTIELKVQKGDLSAFLFNNLPWRPLHTVHHDALLIPAGHFDQSNPKSGVA